MAGFFQQFLRGAAKGFLGYNDAYLKDFKHASKTFTTNAYGNSPKYKWLFHVNFQINKSQIAEQWEKVFPSTTNYGLLVKSIDLPKFSVQLEELNQYNRKRYVQTKIKYDPVRIVFHDDNLDQIRQLWFNYFSYYYNDPSQPGGSQFNARQDLAAIALNKRNIYDSSISGQTDWGYIGESSPIASGGESYDTRKAPFFRAIKIYGFNQHNFALYELINPIIETFGHDNYNYYETRSVMENQMTIRYETVKYWQGAINGKTPGELVTEFGSPANYDRELSPLAIPGNQKTILGQGGLVDAAGGILEDLSNGNILGAISTAGRTARTFKDVNVGKAIEKAAKSEAMRQITQAASNPQTQRSLFNFAAAGATSAVRTVSSAVGSTRNTQAPRIPTSGNTPI